MNNRSQDPANSLVQSRPLAGIVVAYLSCAIIGGTFWFAVRLTVSTDGTGYPPCAAAAIRFLLSAMMFTAAWCTGIFGKPVLSLQLLWFAGAGAASAFAHIFIYTAQVRLTGGLVSVILATSPLVVAIILWWRRTETITGAVFAASVIATAGVAVVYADSLAVPGDSNAVIKVAVAVLIFACSNVIFKECDGHFIGKITASFYGGSVVLVIAFFVQAERLPLPPPPVPTSALLCTVTASLAFGAYVWMLNHVRLMTAMTLSFVQPVIAVTTDTLWESHNLRPAAYAGIAVVLAGVALNWFCTPRSAECLNVDTPAAEGAHLVESAPAEDSV